MGSVRPGWDLCDTALSRVFAGWGLHGTAVAQYLTTVDPGSEMIWIVICAMCATLQTQGSMVLQ